jgi:short-subunit dehydrogenase
MYQERANNTSIYEVDITYTEGATQCIDKIFRELQKIDLAIVCAGTGDVNTELLFEKELGAIRTNVVGWTAAVDCIYNHFQQQNKGHLVTITSIGGLAGEPAAPAYSATKAYQINYTQVLRKKSKKTGVCVTEVRPGLVDTDMAKGEGLFWVMPPEKVAKQIMRAIARKKSKVVVTKRWRIISFLLKHL